MFVGLPKLPIEFYKKLEIASCAHKFIAIYHKPSIKAILRQTSETIGVCLDSWPFFALVIHPTIGDIFETLKINLLSGEHWLVYDSENQNLFVADRLTARKCINT
jgi:hypothetical protein